MDLVDYDLLILLSILFQILKVDLPALLLVFFVIGDGGCTAVFVIIFFTTFFRGHRNKIAISTVAEIKV